MDRVLERCASSSILGLVRRRCVRRLDAKADLKETKLSTRHGTPPDKKLDSRTLIKKD